ncbi:MAG: T9SS type A sorting domain-containing protein [Flavobacteriales bacterium]|nr:T9SS type A sorting domain-containing protein [Flavobacteriales bacterium]MBP9080431.1 T9SS type A sorting domain-containing protein [Flavobacteriales bacterium]
MFNTSEQEHGAGQAQPLQIAPNPSSGTTTFTTKAQVRQGTLQVHDSSGHLVLQAVWPPGSSSYTLEPGAVAPGAYVVRVQPGAAGAAAQDSAGGLRGQAGGTAVRRVWNVLARVPE